MVKLRDIRGKKVNKLMLYCLVAKKRFDGGIQL